MNKMNSWASDELRNTVILDCWCEYIGFLLEVIIKEDGIVLCFSNDDCIILPLLKNLKDEAVDLEECNISILCTDLKEKPYILRREDQNY
jgi:hypothetical protein